jgi:hypothetical protein
VRGCLGFLLFVGTAVAVLAFVAVQLALPAVAASAVKASPLLRDQDVTVSVETSFAGVLLHGDLDRVVITGQNLTEPRAAVGRVSVTLSGVSILDRTFVSAAGTLTGVDVGVGATSPIHVDVVNLGGSGSTLTAEIQVGAAAATTAMRDRLRAAGVPVDVVSLAAGHVDLTIGGLVIASQVAMTESSVSLDAGPLLPSLPILSAPAGGEWRIDQVEVTPAGLRIVVSVPVT